MTALHFAHAGNHAGVIKLLKEKLSGESSSLKDNKGRRPEQCVGVQLKL